ncbi:MAG: hypothetical protein QXX17_03250 [Conexivisphaerales archaeon]
MVKVGRYDMPRIDIDDAVGRLQKARTNIGGRVAKREVFAEAMGLKGVGGQTSHVISAMAIYGLVETGSGEVRITDLGELTLFGDPNEANQSKAKAIWNVELFREIYQTYGIRPTDEQLRAFLRQKAMITDLQQIPILAERIGKLLIKHLPYASLAERPQAPAPTEGAGEAIGRREIEKVAEQPTDVIEIRYGKYQLRIPPEDFETIQAQFNVALAYLKKKLSSRGE